MQNRPLQVSQYATSCGIESAAIHHDVKQSTVERYMRAHRGAAVVAYQKPELLPLVHNQLTKAAAQSLFGYGDGLLFWAHDVSNSVKENDQAGCLCTTGYYKVRWQGRPYKTHNLIWNFHHGLIPAGLTVDHIDGNCRKNEIENLRLATLEMQSVNRECCRNRSKWGIGVSKRAPERYVATFRAYHLGTFEYPKEARECVEYVRERWMSCQLMVVQQIISGELGVAAFNRAKINGRTWTKTMVKLWSVSC